MIHLVTGFTGGVVPVIVERIFRKDPEASFCFALRRDGTGRGALQRMHSVIDTLALDPGEKEALRVRSRAVEIDVERDGLGIAPGDFSEIVSRAGKILHGAADVRFDQPYHAIRIPNVVFTQKIHALHRAIFERRKASGATLPTLYYLSTAYAYGVHPAPVPEDYPEFHPGPPDNTYARTKAEAKRFVLEQIRRLDDRIVIFEPSIIGGAAADGRTRAYNVHYVLLMLGYLGRLPFLSAPHHTLDIVPVDWVAEVVSDIVVRDELHQGVIRLVAGRDAVPIRYLYDVGHAWYAANDPVAGHRVPRIRFVPRWLLPPASATVREMYRALHAVGRDPRHRKRVQQIALLEGFLPYIVRRKVFENERSTELIRRHTSCERAPLLQDRHDADGRLLARGYYEKILADTLRTGWGGLVDFRRVEASLRSPLGAATRSGDGPRPSL